MPGIPSSIEDRVFYETLDLFPTKDINVFLQDGAAFNIWGELNINGQPYYDNVKNILEYGAVADFDIATGVPVTDSTSAIQQAITNCPIGGLVLIPPAPPGKSYYCGKVTINKTLTIAGLNRYGSRVTAKAGTVDAIFDLVWDASGLEENHKYGVTLKDLYIDGNRRTVTAAGIRINIYDRVTIDNVQIRNFQRQAVLVQQSLRESYIRGLYVKWCGSVGYPAIDINDSYIGDGSNNIMFDACHWVYSLGPTLRIEKSAGFAARSIFFNNCMLHGVAEISMAGPDFHDNGDGVLYPVSGTELEAPLIDLASVRDIYFTNCRIHATGYGQPHIMVRESVGGIVTAKLVAANMCSFGDWQARTLAAVSAAANVFTSANHRLGTGALVRVTGSSLSTTVDYWVIKLSANTFSLASTRANAFLGTAVAVVDASGITVTCQNRVLDLDIPFVGNGGAIVSNSFALSANQRAVIINRTTVPTAAVTSAVPIFSGVQVELV